MIYVLFIIALLILSIFFLARNGQEKEIPINVMVLGFPRAGKTVLLASMYHQLAIPGETGFSLHADPEKRNKLSEIYDQVADTQKDFPPPTLIGNITEWEFVGRIKSVGENYDLIKFTYLDYAGELAEALFKTNYEAMDADFENKLNNADVLLSILDGEQVLKLMENAGEREFFNHIRIMLSIMADRDKPVHFVLTKWDLLHDKYQLKQILASLEEIDQFKAFVASHTALGKLRLIPVSAVGMGFARQDSNTMSKIHGVQMHPFQADMPIACILPDLVAAKKRKLRNQFWLVGVAVFFLSKISFTLNLGVLTASLDHPFDNVDYWAQGAPKRLEIQNMPHISQIRSKRDALNYIYWFFVRMLDKLEFDFPDSDVSRLKRGSRPSGTP